MNGDDTLRLLVEDDGRRIGGHWEGHGELRGYELAAS